MISEYPSLPLRDLLITTKDGDWGRDTPAEGYMPFRIIRGTDFPGARIGDIRNIPRRYIDEASASRRTLEPNDILIETAGGSPTRPTGRTLLITDTLLLAMDSSATCASFARFLRVDPTKADPRYVYWYLQWLYVSGRMEEHQVQHTGVARFQYTRFAATQEIPLPSLGYQSRIAEILGSLDAKIELNRRQNRTLQDIARTIFKAWFVEFAPTKAKCDGEAGFLGMPQCIYDNLPGQFSETDLGRVPTGWQYAPIGQLVEVVGGATPSTKNPAFWEEGKYPFCTPKDMSRLDSFVLLDTERHITEAGMEKISSRQLPPGTVLLSSRAPIGYLAIAEVPVSVNQGIIAMPPGELPSTYILLWAEARMEEIEARATGSTFAEISKRNFRPILALQPDQRTLDAFRDVTQPILRQVAANVRQSRTIEALRDALLPKLLLGQIQV